MHREGEPADEPPRRDSGDPAADPGREVPGDETTRLGTGPRPRPEDHTLVFSGVTRTSGQPETAAGADAGPGPEADHGPDAEAGPEIIGAGADTVPPTVIADRYTLGRQLGRGGMGVVWEALDNRLNRQVAVKGLLLRGSADPDTRAMWVERARREAQAIARIGHQNVVAVHDVIEAEGQVWIVMELVNAHSLADLLREDRQLPVPQSARIGLQVLRGLRAVHEAGVLHRDVKPHNVLFRPNGRALLMDFGIATFEGAIQVTRSQELIGTPRYLAPELVSGPSEEQRLATPESDLWSLGVTLFEMVEGRPPFNGLSTYEILIAVRATPTPPMRYAGPLGPLIEALLNKDPRQRPTAQDAEEILQRIIRETSEPYGPLADIGPGRMAYGAGAGPGGRPPRPPAPPSVPPTAGSGSGWSRAVRALRRLPGLRAGGWRAGSVLAACMVLLVGGGWFTVDRLDIGDGGGGGLSASDSPTLREARTRGALRIGVKQNQPGLSELTGKGWTGFDVELARDIAADLGFTKPSEVQFVSVPSVNRESELLNDNVDLVVASYSITPDREEIGISFAGPYFNAGQRMLMRKGDAEGEFSVRDPETRAYGSMKISGPSELPDHTATCTGNESTSRGLMKKQEYRDKFRVKEHTDYDICVQMLLDKEVDVVTTDDVILAGFRHQHPDRLELAGRTLTSERYGVGMADGDRALHHQVCEALDKEMDSDAWQKLYDRYLKKQLDGVSKFPPVKEQRKECRTD